MEFNACGIEYMELQMKKRVLQSNCMALLYTTDHFKTL
jgi:hypothetical protein